MGSSQEAKPPVNTPTTFPETASIRGDPEDPAAVAPFDHTTWKFHI